MGQIMERFTIKESGFHSKFFTWHIVTQPKETFGIHPICQVEGM